MGVDIHMHIVSATGELLHKNIFEGRNSEWFDNLCGHGWNNEYDYLSAEYGVPEVESLDKTIYDDYQNAKKYGFYDFRHVKVRDFISWFAKYEPNKDAGWFSTYEKWFYETKGIVLPECPPKYLDPELNRNDYYFIEYINPCDCSKSIIDFLIDQKVPADAYIVYYFDC